MSKQKYRRVTFKRAKKAYENYQQSLPPSPEFWDIMSRYFVDEAPWVLRYRARYNRWLQEPNRLIVWDMQTNKEKQLSLFELENCKIRIKYENSIKQEKVCKAKMIIEIYVRDE
tara:strand:+ start:113 stop:454 length:342 start_codon:yes stop_codon:yes gene_type:complete